MIADLERAPGMRVAELGAGTGRFTAEIADWLPDDGTGIAVDIDPVFVAGLQGRFARVECVCDRAERLVDLMRDRHIDAFDHIVSGLPFASLPSSTTQHILFAVGRSLRVGGTFTTFQYVHAWQFPSASKFRRAATERLGSNPTSRLVLANVPPALVLRWRKTADNGPR